MHEKKFSMHENEVFSQSFSCIEFPSVTFGGGGGGGGGDISIFLHRNILFMHGNTIFIHGNFIFMHEIFVPRYFHA